MTPETRAIEGFRTRHETDPDLVVQAPGRVNLMGDHTDYNDGFVLPCAIDHRTVIAARRRQDRQVRITALDLEDATDAFPLDQPIEHALETGGPAAGWANYPRGAAQVLLRHGHRLPGADLVIAGDVPPGAGLSSSASLLVATIETLRRLAGLASLDPTDVAVLAREAEVGFVGVSCGIMDQLISARGEQGAALEIDCRSLATRAVPIHRDLAILIVHSGVERGLVGSEYNTRRAECEAAAAHFGVPALRDLDEATLRAAERDLDPVVWRRALHIVTENDRVGATAAALEARDTASLARLMAASHASLSRDFAISTPEIDRLVELIAGAIGDQGGVRMTGGGFGGCVVAVLAQDALARARDAVAASYRTPGGLPARQFVCSPSAGAGEVAR